MNDQMDKSLLNQGYTAGFFGLIVGALGTCLFKYTIYDGYFAAKRFPDYGPTMYAGGDAAIWTMLYVVLIAFSFAATVLIYLLLQRSARMSGLVRKIPIGLIILTVACLGVTVIPVKLATLAGSPSDIITHSIYLLLGLGATWCLLQFQSAKVGLILESFLYFFFGTILLLQAPKLHGIYYLVASSGEQASFGMLLLAISLFIVVVTYLVASTFDQKTFGRVLAILVGVYFLSIMEGRIYWTSDGFHDAEGFLSASILTGKSSIYHGGTFVPTHGYFRNIWPSYAAVFIQSNNYFVFRLTEALLVPFVNVCLVACVIGLAQRLAVGVAVFCLIYVFKVFIPFDNEMVLAIAVLVSLLKPAPGGPDKLLRSGLGLILVLLSLVSFELMLFVNVALLALLAKISLDHYFGREGPPARLKEALVTHFVYYGGVILLAVSNPGRTAATIHQLLDSFSKSPNLLERTVYLTGQFETIWFFILAFGPVGIWFYLGNVSSFFRFDGRARNPEWAIRNLVSMLFLMFYIRAFNRSDDGHFLYALWVSLPLALGYLIRDKTIPADRFVSLTSIILLGMIANEIYNGHAPIERLKQASWFDSRINRESIKPVESIGRIKAPVGTFGEDLISREELRRFIGLQTKGYDLFDLVNMPTVFYGVAGFSITARDFHTLFLNTYKEQRGIIEGLQRHDKALVVWSANYWTETLDYTYVETRLPMITQFITSQFRHIYKVGRFVVLSKYEVPELADAAASNDVLRKDYNLGKAPAKMAPYKQERLQRSADVALPNSSEQKPDALQLIFPSGSRGKRLLKIVADNIEVVTIGFEAVNGADFYFIRLSNLPRYNMENRPLTISVLDERGQGVLGCRVTGLWFFPTE